MSSLGRVGRILAGSVDASSISVDRESSTQLNISPGSHKATSSINSNSPDTNKTTQSTEDNPNSPSNRKENKIMLQGKL